MIRIVKNRSIARVDVQQEVPYVESPSTQPLPAEVVLPREVVRHPSYQSWVRLHSKDLWTKQEAYEYARVARATWDRMRLAKRRGTPGFEAFPEDVRPSGNPKGRVSHRRVEVIAWVNSQSR